MVVLGIVPQCSGIGTALRPLCLHTDRRHLPQHGCQSGGSSDDFGYTEVEDHVPHYLTYGKAGDPFHDPAGIRKRHGKLSRTSLSGTDHSVHQVHLHELQVYRGSQYSCHHHDDLRCGDPVNEPDELKEP